MDKAEVEAATIYTEKKLGKAGRRFRPRISVTPSVIPRQEAALKRIWLVQESAKGKTGWRVNTLLTHKASVYLGELG